MKKKRYALDIETYPNYFLATFKEFGKEVYHEFVMDTITGRDDFRDNREKIIEIAEKHEVVTFNGRNFDLPILNYVLNQSAASPRMIKRGEVTSTEDKLKGSMAMVDLIIGERKAGWMFNQGVRCEKTRKVYKVKEYFKHHIDIQEPLPGVGVSLKLYGCRSGFPKLQELPIEPNTMLTYDEAEALRIYCRNDVALTEYLAGMIISQLDIRKQLTDKYGTDMMSKSDAQCAEAIIRSYLSDEEVEVRKRTKSVKPFFYKVPSWVKFESPVFNTFLEIVRKTEFKLSSKGAVVLPPEISKPIEFDGNTFKFGIGGLHSQESMLITEPQADEMFGEFDVGSMYPSIICEQGLYPEHLTKKFLDVYDNIRRERLAAKKTDPIKAQMYKIVLNGSYGKFGNKYSFLYSPELLIQTTITGQLSLLMLIEMMTLAGGKVRSANTDGVNVLFKKANQEQIFAMQKKWEDATSYELEYTPYTATYNRDVNSYIAMKESGVKGKGFFAEPGLMKNPEHYIVTEAVIAYLRNGTPIEDTVKACGDITKFISARTVRGGAVKDGEPCGKVVRWYYSTATESAIHYKSNGNTVPKTQGAMPILDLPESLPSDLDYDWYIKVAKQWAGDLEF